MSMKQGIVTILGSDCEKNIAASIRRNLSADMSSKKWLEQNELFSPVKKMASSEEAVPLTPDHDSSSFSSEGEEECERINNNPGRDDVWRMILSHKEVQKPENLDVNWGTILTQKSESSVCNLPRPPYVHPLVKRSASAMSDKSLEICTESLGSETGSDGYSTCLNSEFLGDGDEVKEERTRVGKECTKEPNPFEDFHVVKYKSCPSRPIPPPLSSISGGDGVSLHIRSHRKKGRLVLEAVAVPPRKYFHAQRGDGRLVLSLINSPTSQLENEVGGNKVDEFEKVFVHMEEVDDNIKEAVARVDDDDNEEEDPEFFKEQNSKSLPNQIMSVDKSAVTMQNLTGLGTKNPTWSHKFNKVVDFPATLEIMAKKDVSDVVPISHSLPSLSRMTQLISPPPPLLPPPSAATSFKAYEYFWRSKSTDAGRFINPKIPSTPQAASFKNSKIDAAKAFDQYQEMTPHMKGHNIEYFVPYFRGCNKEPRRSLPISEAHWIATS
ncbi:protein FAF-like, chloroplastic [Primulina huaijiensis]|uniref:protein FAF-like, chloroplastic n=1 Tax=Primulina huaijiensis TaxID=1492673 RepID=UPI003CC77D84